MTAQSAADPQTRLSYLVRALALLAATGLSLGFALGVAITPLSITRYFRENFLPTGLRLRLLACMIGGALAAALCGLLYRLVKGRVPGTSAVAVDRLLHVARRLAPLSLAGFPAMLFRCEAWSGHDLTFLALVLMLGLAAHASFVSAVRAGPLSFEQRLYLRLARVRETFVRAAPRLHRSLPFTLVVIGVVGYSIYFGYYTYCFYYSLRSGYDLGIYDSLLWNMLHGGSFYKTPPWVGPGRSHFGNHAEFFAYVLLPLYAIRQNGGTLLLIQAAFLGSAAIPLYKLARKYTDRWPACILALSYLIYPALHGENLFEFHFLPFGPFLLWWAWYFLECRRDRWAAVFVLLTLSCREDVSSWVAVLGAYFLFTGRRPKAGLLLAVIGTVWCFGLKFVAMPLVGGGESFTDIYKDLLPAGSHSFGGVIRTLLANPAYTMSTLAEMPKLIYMLQILVPLAFLPFRRPIWLVLAIPGFFFSVLSTRYEPLISIHFQYSAHWIAFFFPGVAIALEWMGRQPSVQSGAPGQASNRRRAALFAMVCMALPVSYQYGAIFQQTTAYGGIIKFKFGVDAEGRRRHQAAVRLLQKLPPRAKVSASGFTTPFISNRPDAYNITLGIFDAEYLFFPSEASDFIVDERSTIKRLLDDGEFGVVDIEPPFALAKRGYATDRNAELTRRW
jgi:uncharacterized membrane protein